VKRALAYVELNAVSTDEPYLIAAFVLAALDAGQVSIAAASIERLRKLEHREGDTSYWSLEMNTLFCGWGLPGRVETTALVLQALEKGQAGHEHAQELDDMVSRGMLFLLKNQDEYGVWYTGETRDRHVSGFPKAVSIAAAYVCSDSTSWFSCTTGNPHSTNTGCQTPGGLRGQEKR
jgi:hypothetical protein